MAIIVHMNGFNWTLFGSVELGPRAVGSVHPWPAEGRFTQIFGGGFEADFLAVFAAKARNRLERNEKYKVRTYTSPPCWIHFWLWLQKGKKFLISTRTSSSTVIHSRSKWYAAAITIYFYIILYCFHLIYKNLKKLHSLKGFSKNYILMTYPH